MKNICALILAAFICFTAKSQFTAGDRYITDSVSARFGITTGSGSKQIYYHIGIGPGFLKFKSNKKAEGIRILASYGQVRTFNNGVLARRIEFISAGAVFFKQNYLSLGKGFYVFLEEGINARFDQMKQSDIPFTVSNYISKDYKVSLYATPAIGYKLSDRLIINLNLKDLLNLSYDQSKIESGGPEIRKQRVWDFFTSLSNRPLNFLGVSFGWKLK